MTSSLVLALYQRNVSCSALTQRECSLLSLHCFIKGMFLAQLSHRGNVPCFHSIALSKECSLLSSHDTFSELSAPFHVMSCAVLSARTSCKYTLLSATLIAEHSLAVQQCVVKYKAPCKSRQGDVMQYNSVEFA